MAKEGDSIPIDKFHVSPMNARAGEPFGLAEEDKQLIANLRQGKIVGPFKARPESGGYGVVVGRRRFLAKKTAGAQHLIVGLDCLIEDMSDQEAREASLIENLQMLRRTMNPMLRARQLNDIITFSSIGLRGTARKLGLPASTLSEWLKILELSPKIQESIINGLINYTEALEIARMKLGTDLQDKLAEILEKEGSEAFKRELAKSTAGKMSRGIPRGVYEIDRIVWDKRNRKEMNYHQILSRAAEAKKMKAAQYIKEVIINHIREITKDME